ncbi:hypothetical protein, variant [Fonticula alba]|nr:hypothetical protein, variant [Fonticula alba]KCV67700.1 hypothetical protein, variant [Fonticula alba]|eukprot:XP_009497884.1 hypothetical protein, variant [Fonticula alba]
MLVAALAVDIPFAYLVSRPAASHAPGRAGARSADGSPIQLLKSLPLAEDPSSEAEAPGPGAVLPSGLSGSWSMSSIATLLDEDRSEPGQPAGGGVGPDGPADAMAAPAALASSRPVEWLRHRRRQAHVRPRRRFQVGQSIADLNQALVRLFSEVYIGPESRRGFRPFADPGVLHGALLVPLVLLALRAHLNFNMQYGVPARGEPGIWPLAGVAIPVGGDPVGYLSQLLGVSLSCSLVFLGQALWDLLREVAARQRPGTRRPEPWVGRLRAVRAVVTGAGSLLLPALLASPLPGLVAALLVAPWPVAWGALVAGVRVALGPAGCPAAGRPAALAWALCRGRWALSSVDPARFLLALVALHGYRLVMKLTPRVFPRSFTRGEASVLVQLVVFLMVDAGLATITQLDLASVPPSWRFNRPVILLYTEALFLGCLLISTVGYPVLLLLRYSNRRFGPRSPQSAALAGGFLLLLAALLHWVVCPWLGGLIGIHPAVWTIQFIGASRRRGLILAYWIVLLVVALAGLALFGRSRSQAPKAAGGPSAAAPPVAASDSTGSLLLAAAGSGPPIDLVLGEEDLRLLRRQKNSKRGHFHGVPIHLIRKYFHLVAVVMFVPCYLLDPSFLQLSFGIALALLLLVEIIRHFRFPVLGPAVDQAFGVFLDARDCGPVVLSHLYLLIGCALPVWLSPAVLLDSGALSDFASSRSVLAGLSGILALGVGDTAASAFGLSFGRHRWPGSRKTIEGTLGGLLSTLLTVALSAVAFGFVSFSSSHWSLYSTALAFSALLEALTFQNDNLIVPLYLFSAVSLMAG